jgi:uncharacterized membrane protein YsdA (DUF1294 family)
MGIIVFAIIGGAIGLYVGVKMYHNDAYHEALDAFRKLVFDRKI